MFEALIGDINLEKYMGEWLQMAAKPAFFQSGCNKSYAKYKLEYEGDTPIIKVENSCFKNGKLSVSNGTARVKSGRTLSVKFSPFMNIFNKPNYEIYYIDKGYNVAVVGSPNKDYLWILSRQVIPKEQILELLEVANGFGFDTSDIKFDMWEK